MYNILHKNRERYLATFVVMSKQTKLGMVMYRIKRLSSSALNWVFWGGELFKIELFFYTIV